MVAIEEFMNWLWANGVDGIISILDYINKLFGQG